MPIFREKKILPYYYRDLFNLVLDVASYPEFLPWFKDLKITSRGEGFIMAKALVSYKNLVFEYECKITEEEDERGILYVKTQGISGPFKTLVSVWGFEKKESDLSEIAFFIDFSLDSFILETIASSVLGLASKKIIDAFEKRAFKLLSG